MAQQPQAERVYVLAYSLWQERGCPDGSPEIDWYRAERLLQVELGELGRDRTKETKLATEQEADGFLVQSADLSTTQSVPPLKRRSRRKGENNLTA